MLTGNDPHESTDKAPTLAEIKDEIIKIYSGIAVDTVKVMDKFRKDVVNAPSVQEIKRILSSAQNSVGKAVVDAGSNMKPKLEAAKNQMKGIYDYITKMYRNEAEQQ